MPKQMMTPQQFAMELQEQVRTKQDFLVDSRELLAITEEGQTRLWFQDEGRVVRDTAHSNLAEYTGIPKVYYDRMRHDAPSLFDDNLNTWLMRKEEKRMIRVLGGQVRAVLSDRYNRIDNFDLAAIALKSFEGHDVEWKSCGITETHMRMKVTFPALKRPSPAHPEFDIEFGCIIQNSEIGQGAALIAPYSEEMWCRNGATHFRYGKRKAHVGSQLVADGSGIILSDETREASDKAMMLTFRDIMASTITDLMADQIHAEYAAAAGNPVASPVAALKVLAKQSLLTEGEAEAAIALLSKYPPTQYGIAGAITEMSQRDETSYDRASDLERVGGDILAMARAEFAPLATAS